MLVDIANQPDVMTMQTAFADERPRLVAFCAHVCGSWDAAEDLAQESLLVLTLWWMRHRITCAAVPVDSSE